MECNILVDIRKVTNAPYGPTPILRASDAIIVPARSLFDVNAITGFLKSSFLQD